MKCGCVERWCRSIVMEFATSAQRDELKKKKKKTLLICETKLTSVIWIRDLCSRP